MLKVDKIAFDGVIDFLYVELFNHLDVKNIVWLGLFAFGTRHVDFPART